MEILRGLGLWLLISDCFLLRSNDGLYLPGSHPNKYLVGDPLMVKVNWLTSVDAEELMAYYSLPFCHPIEGIKDMTNLSEHLMGDRIMSTPYCFETFINETDVLLCRSDPLTAGAVDFSRKCIDGMYHINMILDNLPVIRYAKKDGFLRRWTGYPVGVRSGDAYYVFNHLKFTVLVHKYEEETNVASRMMSARDEAETAAPAGWVVVGFEVTPCSFQHDVESIKSAVRMHGKYPTKIQCDLTEVSMRIMENQTIVFTYEVEFVESDITRSSRWGVHSKMEGAKVHWFSILNSLTVIAFLASVVLLILSRIVRRDLTRYEAAEAQMKEELSGWKFVVGDVFRAPSRPTLLCVMAGDGVQILGMAVVTIFLAALGFTSPASRGNLVAGMLLCYLILGIAAGYVAVRTWKTIKVGDPSGLTSVCYFFPGITFFTMIALDSLLWGRRRISFSVFTALFLLWFCISVPLTLLGGFLGAKAPHVEYPVRTNHIPREVPPNKCSSWLLVLGAGTLPFGALFIELFFIMSSIWKSSFASGSVAIYVFLYLVSYLIVAVKSSHRPVSDTLYLGYSLLMVIATMLTTGAVGFISSFWFVHYLFSSVKLD